MRLLAVVVLVLVAVATGSSWYEQPQPGWPSATDWAGMPGVQRTDVLIQGKHPVVILIAPFNVSVGNGALPCTEIAVDIPFRRAMPAATVGAATLFLWDATNPPHGSGSITMSIVRESWSDSASRPIQGAITVYRFAHNLTALASLDPGLYYLGFFVDVAGYAPGTMDWLAAPVAGSAAPAFLYLDRYGSFLPNVTLAQPQSMVTTAPKATDYYSTTGTAVYSLPLKVWTRCSDSAGAAALPPISTLAPPPSPVGSPAGSSSSSSSASPSSVSPSPSPTPTVMLSPPSPSPSHVVVVAETPTPSPPPPSSLSSSGVSPTPTASDVIIGIQATRIVATNVTTTTTTPPSSDTGPSPLELSVLGFGLSMGAAVVIIAVIAGIIGGCVIYRSRRRAEVLRMANLYGHPDGHDDVTPAGSDDDDDEEAISLEEDKETKELYQDLEPKTASGEAISAAIDVATAARRRQEPFAEVIAVGTTPRDERVTVPLTSPDLAGDAGD